MLKNFYLDSHKLKEALMEAEQCPICQIVEDAISWHLESFLSEHICDVKIRALWREAGGLCPGHTQLLEKSGPPLPRAILYHDLITSHIPSPPQKRRWRKNKPQRKCPVCEQVAQIEKGYLGLLYESLAKGSFHELLAASSCFCLPHWRGFLAVSKPGAAQDAFQKAQLEKTAALTKNLSEFIRKHDWRYNDEALLPEEGSSPKAGARFLVGAPWLGRQSGSEINV